MLFRKDVLERIAHGEVSLALRRWKRATVKPGGRLRTSSGVLRIGAVECIEAAALADADARAAGHADRAEAFKALGGAERGDLYRIEIVGLEPDERDSLREQTNISAAEWDDLHARLDRWDKSAPSYHRSILDLIARHPATAAGLLAEALGVDKPKFKRDVRALKELGLTESLDTGYRLSPRGRRVLKRLAEGA